jgi:hypothetical protein
MPSVDDSEIDQLSEAYEKYRTVDRSGPISLTQFLHEHGRGENPSPLLITELVQIDVQLNWMAWGTRLPEMLENNELDTVRERFLRIPRLDDYLEIPLLNVVSQDQKSLEAMARCEMESRNYWGDAIGPVFYHAKYGLNLPPDPDHSPNFVFCYFDGPLDGKEVFKFEFRGKTIIGRQRSTDVKQLFCEESPHGNRIVIASHSERKISREQLLVELLNKRYAIVSNLSAINPVVTVGLGVLSPQRSEILQIPFGLRLPDRRLSFAAPGLSIL